jgi:cytochrome c peroxidase
VKRSRFYLTAVILFGPVFGLLTISLPPVRAVAAQGELAVTPLPEVAPSPPENPLTPEKVALGKQLFFDPRLSGNNQMSCATCHLPEKGFTDGLATARGAGEKSLARNTQTLLNVGFYNTYFWDGRAKSLEAQALAPIRSPDEMNQDLGELVRELSAIPGYVQQFQAVFKTGVTEEGVAQALAAFERTLVSRNSPFDRFLAGDQSALSHDAREGWQVFQNAGCIRCHNGPVLSDSKFYRIGAGFGYRDRGRGDITGAKQDLYAFRTPGLRDVARTAPYMHDGSLDTLEQVVEFYFRSTSAPPPDGLRLDIEPLVGRSFSEVGALVAFLEALSGEPPNVSPPQLP